MMKRMLRNVSLWLPNVIVYFKFFYCGGEGKYVLMT